MIRPFPVNFLRWNTAVIACHKEENQEIQDRGNNSYSTAPAGDDHFINDQCRINACHPLHLDWNNKIQHDPHIRITHRKCEENCHVNVICAEAGSHWNRCIHTVDYKQEQCAKHSKNHTTKNIYIEPKRSPGAFQGSTKLIIQYNHNNGKNKIAGWWWNQYPWHQSPDLPIMEDHKRLQCQEAVCLRGQKFDQISCHIEKNNVFHQSLNGKSAKLSFHFI